MASGREAPPLILPASALLAEGDARYVWRVERPSGRVGRIAVRVEAAADGRMFVLDGLSEGDEVVTRGIHSLTEGQIVGPQVAPCAASICPTGHCATGRSSGS